MPSIETLSSGRHRARAWNPATRRYETVSNPEPGSRGTWPAGEWDRANRAAEDRERELKDIYAGIDLGPQRRRRVSFEECADRWVAIKAGGSKQSAQTIRSEARALKKAFAGTMIADITEGMILEVEARWRSEKRQPKHRRNEQLVKDDAGLSASSRSRRRSYLRQIMQRAIGDGHRDTDPTARLALDHPIRVPKGTPHPADEQDVQLLLTYLPEWFRPAAILAFDSGLRAAEVCGLRWFRLRLDGPEPQVRVVDVMQIDMTLRGHTKGGEGTERTVPLSPRTVVALRELRARRSGERDGDFVFRGARNAPLHPNRPSELMLTAFVASGLPGDNPTFHALRHSCGSGLADRRAPAPVIRDILGHANLATAQVYIHATPMDMRRDFLNAHAEGRPFLRLVEEGPAAGSRSPDERAS